MDDFSKLDLECFMKLFRNEIYIMSLEIIYLCNFYFNIIYLNNGKSCKQSNQVKYLIFEGGRERKSAGSLGMLGFGVSFVEHRGTISFKRPWIWGICKPGQPLPQTDG